MSPQLSLALSLAFDRLEHDLLEALAVLRADDGSPRAAEVEALLQASIRRLANMRKAVGACDEASAP